MQKMTAGRLDAPVARIASIDWVRGLIMIIMAIDHTRDFFHADAQVYDPTSLSRTTPILFFTRWITHFCAPGFMFLSGMSACLVGKRKTKKELSLFLLKRGLWVVFLEFTAFHFGMYFNLFAPEVDFVVFWALGISMIALAGLVYFSRNFILVFGLLMVAGHNLLDGISFTPDTLGAFEWSLLHKPGFFTYKGISILVAYPVVPWIGVMALGYWLGGLYSNEVAAGRRKKVLLRLGIILSLLFVLLRFINVYGDPSHWSYQSSPVFTLLSFLKTTKYPPSLLYLLMTLGPLIVLLSVTERSPGWLGRRISVYGRVPLFYFLAHIYLLHLIALAATNFCGHKWTDMILDQVLGLDPKLKGYGFSLGVVYAVWAAVVLSLYPLCSRYDRYKRANKDKWWLSYL